MSEISVIMQNLEADVTALHARMLIERAVADYWYERATTAEKKLVELLPGYPEL